ncbi:hypothetical protein [Synechococcus sp. PROS-U-1]|uniref:hypothetical protein n=1 Tax=Synechococcus sp. PROS-U-1 TaxID=1400866 RepID=UPI001CA39402|nr:hypothetical protein [Synechococcus sp. PROS-U-1]
MSSDSEFNRLLVQNPDAPSACMTATWTITRLPSQVRVRPQADRSGTLRRQLARRAKGIPDPSTWMW